MHTVDALGAADRIRARQLQMDVLVHQLLDAVLEIVRQFEAIGAEQLDAVVLVGVVRGGNHHADVGAQRAGQHRHRRRRDRSEQEHVETRGREPRHQRVLDHVAR